jgi:RNA polymerase sigma-70 factor (ECF subfamily)
MITRSRVGDQMPDARSDSELLVASRNDPAAFRLFYERWAKQMFGYFYRRTFDPHVSADLLAETFAVAWEKRSRFRDIGRPAGGWLYGIARRELSRYRRRRRIELSAVRRLGMSVPTIDDDELERIEDAVDASAYRADLVAALDRLNARDRDSIRLRVVEGLTFREVGEELGCSEGAARVRVHRALTKVAAQMGVQQ